MPRLRCRYFDNDGGLIDGGCRRASNCIFVHPDHEAWASTPQPSCRFYDNSGEPIDGGCRSRMTGKCRFTHPGDELWSEVVASRKDPIKRQRSTNGSNSGSVQRTARGGNVKCKFFEDDGTPIDGGCFGSTTGDCRYIHPNDLGWQDATRRQYARPGRDSSSRVASSGKSAWDSVDLPRRDTVSERRSERTSTTDDSPSGWGKSLATNDASSCGWGATDQKSVWGASDSDGWGATSSNKGWNAPAADNGWGAPKSSSGSGAVDSTISDTSTGWGSSKQKDDGWGSPKPKDGSGISDNGWGAVDTGDGWGTTDSNAGWGALSSNDGWGASDKNAGWGEPSASAEDAQGGWGPVPTAQDDSSAKESPIRSPRLSKQLPAQMSHTTSSQTADMEVTQLRNDSPFSPAIPSQAMSDTDHSPFTWQEFLRTLRRAVILQFQSNQASKEYQKARRTQISDAYGHAGAGARAILEDWCHGKSQQRARLRMELATAIDKVAASYDAFMERPIDLDTMHKRTAEMKQTLETLNDDLSKRLGRHESSPQVPSQPQKKSLSDKADDLRAVFDNLIREFEEAVSYSYDDGLLQRLDAQAQRMQINEDKDNPSLKDTADALNEQAKGLNSSFNPLLDQHLSVVGGQVDKDLERKLLSEMLKKQEDAYSADLVLVEQMEAEVTEETAMIGSMSEAIQRILTAQIVPQNQSDDSNTKLVTTVVNSVIQEHAEVLDKLMEHASEAKRIAVQDAEDVSVQLLRALKPAHYMIEAVHHFVQPRVINGHST